MLNDNEGAPPHLFATRWKLVIHPRPHKAPERLLSLPEMNLFVPSRVIPNVFDPS